eukprot:192241-Amphidinium_carterae.1
MSRACLLWRVLTRSRRMQFSKRGSRALDMGFPMWACAIALSLALSADGQFCQPSRESNTSRHGSLSAQKENNSVPPPKNKDGIGSKRNGKTNIEHARIYIFAVHASVGGQNAAEAAKQCVEKAVGDLQDILIPRDIYSFMLTEAEYLEAIEVSQHACLLPDQKLKRIVRQYIHTEFLTRG